MLFYSCLVVFRFFRGFRVVFFKVFLRCFYGISKLVLICAASTAISGLMQSLQRNARSWIFVFLGP